MTKEELSAQAVIYKHSGCNCCQAVVKTLTEGTELPESVLMNMASGFGMGMGCMEATCGALVGANLVLGLKGRGRMSRTLLKRFEELCGASICRDLKGRDTGVILASCDECVTNAVLAACELLDM